MVHCVTVGQSESNAHFNPSRLEGQATTIPDDLQHLPVPVAENIAQWRHFLEHAKCLKVTVDAEQTWVSMHELDETGSPRLLRHERFEIHSWMTPDLLWLTIYFSDDGSPPDTSRPATQLLWRADSGMVWERVWQPSTQRYTARKYRSDEPTGPLDATVIGNESCIYATTARTWLGTTSPLAARPTGDTVGIYRSPNLSIVPPVPDAPGVWLDVFDDRLVRDQDDDPEELYRRDDFMRIAADDKGLPVLAEWRTIVMSDSVHGGTTPQQIVGVRRFEYQCFDLPPTELMSVISQHQALIEKSIKCSGSLSDVSARSMPQNEHP